MKVLFKDEKYISENVHILSQLMIDANITEKYISETVDILSQLIDANITGSPQVGHNINLRRIHIQDIELVL